LKLKSIRNFVYNGFCCFIVGLCALGELMTFKARYADATKLLTRSYEMMSKLVGSQHPSVARIKCALAENLRLPGAFEICSELSTTSLNVRLHVFGPKNPCFALGLYNRAQILRDLDNLEEAEKLYSSALKIIKNSVGEESAHFALILGDVGECLRKLGHLDNARLVLAKAVELKKKALGEHNVSVYESIVAQALVEMDLNDVTNYQNALYVLNELVLPNLVPIVGNSHPLVSYVKANIGLCMNAIAMLFMEKGMIGRLEAMVGPDHPLMSRVRKPSGMSTDAPTIVGFDEKPVDASELPGQLFIDTALQDWENYPQCQFSSLHPWLKRFGV
jgi:tetratricopeptide (TPR) repeat protein